MGQLKETMHFQESIFMRTNCKQEPVSASLATKTAQKCAVQNQQSPSCQQNYLEKPRIYARFCRNGCSRIRKITKRTQEPLMMSGFFDGNKRVSSNKPLIMSGLGLFRTAIEGNISPTPDDANCRMISDVQRILPDDRLILTSRTRQTK
jgi:hypothetical protein